MNIELENYLFNPSTVRVKGEDVYLFHVGASAEHARTKNDADEIAKHIVKRVNGHDELVKALQEFLKVIYIHF